MFDILICEIVFTVQQFPAPYITKNVRGRYAYWEICKKIRLFPVMIQLKNVKLIRFLTRIMNEKVNLVCNHLKFLKDTNMFCL